MTGIEGSKYQASDDLRSVIHNIFVRYFAAMVSPSNLDPHYTLMHNFLFNRLCELGAAYIGSR